MCIQLKPIVFGVLYADLIGPSVEDRKTVVLHDGREEVHMTQLTGSLLQIQVPVLELDEAHLNELRLA